ncbi:CLUMA_CG001038, isoform A [Clunio marinus]|uniref:CLUMA_CG001038, isoform A n=1 Tax=Clunio marinus TaxID=568069 RepID=A0A1J1HIL4_9DIPT|nr:CLUMA_CG001038, isoform A [Clunio marinus]
MHFIREVLILFLFLKFSLCFTIENKLTYLKSLPGNEDRPSRIVYGGLASPNQFPYFGHYVIQRPSGWIFCGRSN